MDSTATSRNYHRLSDRQGRHVRYVKACAGFLMVFGLINLILSTVGLVVCLVLPASQGPSLPVDILLFIGLPMWALGLPNTICPAVFLKRHPLGRMALRALFGLNIILSFLFAPFVLFNVFGELVSQVNDFVWILVVWMAWTWLNLYGIRLLRHPEVLAWSPVPGPPSRVAAHSAPPPLAGRAHA